jgi:hypothetical protein
VTFVRPLFQPQNPAINGYSLGWLSCTSYAYAMAAAFDRQVSKVMTGEALRRRTGDTVGGTTLAQNDLAAINGWNVDLDIRYRLPWEQVQEKRKRGHGFVLQGHGDAFNGTEFYCGASVNHAIFVPPDNRAMDPSADGRRPGIYRYHAEPYPDLLLRKFAGRLILNLANPHVRLGLGYAYLAFTRDRTAEHQAVIRPRAGMLTREFTTYDVRNLPDGQRRIAGSTRRRTQGFAIPCTEPKRVTTASGDASVSLVKLIHPGHPQDGWWVSSRWEVEV